MLNKKKISIYNYDFEYFDKLIKIKKTETQIAKYKSKVIKYKSNPKYQSLVKSLCNYQLDDAENIEFCEFRLEHCANNSTPYSGVYLWIVDNQIKYVGETIDIKKRFNNGYGHISPRNIFKGGQSTNCKMNQFALDMFNQGKDILIYFHQASKNDRETIEKNILDYCKKSQNIELLNNQNN